MAQEGLLSKHLPSANVAFGTGGRRCARQMIRDVCNVADRIPQWRGESSDMLVVCRDRYLFAVGLLAAWVRGWAVSLPPNAQPDLIREWSRRPDISQLLHDVDDPLGIDLRSLTASSTVGEAPFNQENPGDLVVPWDWKQLNQRDRRLARVWTSGSTGDHQCHEKFGIQLLGEALMLSQHFQLKVGTQIVSTVPSYHIYGLLFSVLLPLVSGASFSRHTPLYPESVVADLQEDGPQCLISVPTHLRTLLSLPENSIRKVDHVFSSGAPLPGDVAESLWGRHGLYITEILGSTETGGIAWRVVPHRDSNWRPLSQVEILPSKNGQLAIVSPFLSPDVQLPYLSEERVRWNDDGSFTHLGRKDDIVKIAGKRISVQEVESRLNAIDGVRDAVVRSRPDSLRGQTLWALVVAPERSRSELREQLLHWIDPVGIPRRFCFVEKIERNENGKLSSAQFLRAFPNTTGDTTGATPGQIPPGELDLFANPRSQGSGSVLFCGIVPEDFFYFRGHFNLYALLPGVVQLSTAIKHSRELWPRLGNLERVLRLKFRKPIRPGVPIQLQLEQGAKERQINFEFRSLDEALSYGVLEFSEGKYDPCPIETSRDERERG